MKEFKVKRSISFKIVSLYIILTFVNVIIISALISINQADLITDNILLQSNKILNEYVAQIDDGNTADAINLIDSSKNSWVIFSPEGFINKTSNSLKKNINSDKHHINIKKVLLLNRNKKRRFLINLDIVNLKVENYITLTKWDENSDVLYFERSITKMTDAISYLVKIIFIAIILSILISALTAFVLFKIIIKPIYIIANATKAISKGKYDHSIEIKSEDEFGLVAFGFNEMANKIKSNVEDLHIQMDVIKQAKRKIEIMASTDELTQLFNRRALFEKLDYSLEMAGRYKKNLGILMFDIDHFKSVNDTYGHHAGDVVLKEVASLLKEVVRKVDYIGRYGGEEFVIVLPETDMVSSLIAAEKIRNAVENLIIQAENQTLNVTISIGVAEFSILQRKHQNITPEAFINFADGALYVAKDSGRNRVEKNNG